MGAANARRARTKMREHLAKFEEHLAAADLIEKKTARESADLYTVQEKLAVHFEYKRAKSKYQGHQVAVQMWAAVAIAESLEPQQGSM